MLAVDGARVVGVLEGADVANVGAATVGKLVGASVGVVVGALVVGVPVGTAVGTPTKSSLRKHEQYAPSSLAVIIPASANHHYYRRKDE